jgi:cytochrome c oxidase subunit 4
MSDHTEASDHGHDHADDGAVHAHISPVPFYVAIFVALLFFTVLTVGQSYVDLGKLNLLVVILIATAKASLVVTFFMHLRHDNKFHALIFVCGLLFIGVFFAYTMNDTEHRGEFDPLNNVKYEPRTGLQAPGGFDIEKAAEDHKKEAEEFEHGGAAPHEGATPPAGGAEQHEKH